MIPEDDPGHIIDKDLTNRAQFLKKCKEVLSLRWRHQYLTVLCERHKVVYGKE